MNMEKIINRIKDHYNLKSEPAISKELGMPLSTFRDNYTKAIESSTKVRTTANMLYEVILKKCIEDDINPNWVFFGKYPKTNNEKEAKIISKNDLKDYQNDDTVTIPYYTDIRASAGGCNNSDDSETEYIVMPKIFLKDMNTKCIHAVKIVGDSMEPNIKENSIVFIDTNDKEQLNNAVFVLNYDNEVYIKRLEFIGDMILLKSDNIVYNTMNAKEKEITIIGKVKNTVSLDSIG